MKSLTSLINQRRHLLSAGAFALLLFTLCPTELSAHFKTEPGMPVHITDARTLEYGAYDNGDRVPDYSWCGYRQSAVPIPMVTGRVRVEAPADGSDATQLLQQAIDYVSLLPMQADGFRGAVVLGAGTFHVSGQLLIRTSGVVVRGAEPGSDGLASATTLVAEGFRKDELIRVLGKEDVRQIGQEHAVSADYVPVGATFLPLDNVEGLQVGDAVRVTRPCTAEWLAVLGTDKIGHQQEYNFSRWSPGQYEQRMERTVTAVHPEGIDVDVPLTISLDSRYGGGRVTEVEEPGRLHNIGIEQLCIRSAYDPQNLKDELHRWQAVTMNHVQDGWVRRVETWHFAGSAVMLLEGVSRVTVEDCNYLQPICEVANHRRYAFHTCGQQTLVQRCYAEGGYHSFSVGRGVPGPNAFVQCQDEMPYSYSGATGGMSSGILFDRCTLVGGTLCYEYRDIADRGAAWTAANSMCWATRASQTHIMTPPEAHNWGYGLWTQPFGNGYYQCSHTFVRPESFFYAQLAARTDSCEQSRVELDRIYLYPTNESAKAQPEYAHEMSVVQRENDMTMPVWSRQMTSQAPLVEAVASVPSLSEVKMPKQWLQQQQRLAQQLAAKAPRLEVVDGRVVRGGMYLNNGSRPGRSIPSSASWQGTGSLSQFYPGHYGRGATEEPDTLVERLAQSGGHVMMHHMGLWYDYRRNDHERNMHADADAWAPFNESPWCRTGIGEAQDRMSRYDLRKLNPWYFARFRQFAEGADREGLALLHEHYFQHNIIEEGAHWCDYPWRAANNVNNGELGFAERQQFAGDKRVYMAEAFYGVDVNPSVKQFHELFIRRSVNEFEGLSGVIHSLGLEYTGPLHFTRFWLETVNGCPEHQLVSLVGTKDVVDAVLADPKYRDMVDIIDIRHWHYRTDGSLYAPEGGRSLAPRQWARIIDPGQTDCASIYKAVREYRDRYPEKAVTYNVSTARPDRSETVAAAWTVLLAGGSLAQVPPCDAVPGLWNRVAQMEPMESADSAYVMGKPGVGYLAYLFGNQLSLDLSSERGRLLLRWLDPRTGELIGRATRVKAGSVVALTAPQKDVVCVLTGSK